MLRKNIIYLLSEIDLIMFFCIIINYIKTKIMFEKKKKKIMEICPELRFVGACVGVTVGEMVGLSVQICVLHSLTSASASPVCALQEA